MIPCTVHDGCKPHAAKNPGALRHAVPVSAPAVRQQYDPPRRPVRFNNPRLQTPPVSGRNQHISNLPPVRRVHNGPAGYLVKQICQKKRKTEVNDRCKRPIPYHDSVSRNARINRCLASGTPGAFRMLMERITSYVPSSKSTGTWVT